MGDGGTPAGAQEPEPAGAGTRMLREIIRTPAFAEIIKTNLPESNPEAARRMVRTVLWEDANISLSLLASAPALVSNLVEAALELGRQLSNFTDELLEDFISQISAELGTAGAAELAEVYGPILERAVLENSEMRARTAATMVAGFNASVGALVRVLERLDENGTAPRAEGSPPLDTAALGRSLTLSARLARRSIDANPYFFSELAEHVDFKEFALAALSIGRGLVLGMVRLLGRISGSLSNLFK